MGCEPYTRPIDFHAVEYVTHSIAMTPATWPVEILLEATLDEARQHVPTVMATLDQTSDGLLMRCAVGNLGWFAHFLTGLPFSFTVLQPPELRAELQRMAERISAMARR